MTDSPLGYRAAGTTQAFELPDDRTIAVYANLQPDRLCLYGVLAWLVIVLLGPVTPVVSLDLEAIVYLLVSFAALLLGIRLGKGRGGSVPSDQPRRIDPAAVPAGLFPATLVVAMVGLSFRIVDRFILRAAPLTLDIADNRNEMLAVTSAPTLLGIVGGLLFPFGLALLPILWSMPPEKRNWRKSAVAYLFLLYPALESLSQAGRSGILQIIIYWAFYSLIFGRNRTVTHRLSVSIPIAVGVLIFFEWIFLLRAEASDSVMLDVVRYSGYALFLQPSDWVVDTLEFNQGVLAVLVSTWLHITQYFGHAFFVFQDNFRDFSGGHTFGLLNFGIFVKAYYNLIGEIDIPDYLAGTGGLSGLSGTFFTSLYYDFGWFFGPSFMVALGVIFEKTYQRTLVRPWQWAPLYALFGTTCLLLMFDNVLLGGVALIAVVSLTLYAVIAGMARRVRDSRR